MKGHNDKIFFFLVGEMPIRYDRTRLFPPQNKWVYQQQERERRVQDLQQSFSQRCFKNVNWKGMCLCKAQLAFAAARQQQQPTAAYNRFHLTRLRWTEN